MWQRKAHVAGRFYPAYPEVLRELVRKLLGAAESEISGEVVGLVSPHAGYDYSGAISAESYNVIENRKFDAVVVISPSHRERFPFSSIMVEGQYTTPLGVVDIHSEIAEAVASGGDTLCASERGHHTGPGMAEHALEVQLPFLQVAFGDDLKIVPVVMGDQSQEVVRELGEAIVKAAGKANVLVVASSDLSHFHPDDQARDIDAVVIEQVRNFNPEGLADAMGGGRAEACGAGPMIAAMIASRAMGADRAKILKYATSADSQYGDKDSVVGYLAAAFIRSKGSVGEKTEAREEQEDEPVEAGSGVALQTERLSDESRMRLLEIAKESAKASVRGEPKPMLEIEGEELQRPGGAFVTLTTRGGGLRGCIGFVQSPDPLYLTVAEVAEGAALRDPRFPPVNPSELERLSFEVSVLSTLVPIEPGEVVVGVHGLMIKRGSSQGLLLPQVPVKYGWDRETYLDQLCIKAGLKPGTWRKDDVVLQAFTAEVIEEPEQPAGDD